MPKEKSAGAIIFRKDPPSHKATDGQGDGKIYYLILHYAPSEPEKKATGSLPKAILRGKRKKKKL